MSVSRLRQWMSVWEATSVDVNVGGYSSGCQCGRLHQWMSVSRLRQWMSVWEATSVDVNVGGYISGCQ